MFNRSDLYKEDVEDGFEDYEGVAEPFSRCQEVINDFYLDTIVSEGRQRRACITSNQTNSRPLSGK